MQGESDEDRIRAKAHELWEAEGRPHGRDSLHWEQAREIIAIQDSQGATLLPRDAGAEETVEEPEEALRNLADFPNLTDQGENLLTSTDREPDFASASPGGGMPSVEVPTSGQPGIPPKKGGKSASRTSSSAPAMPVSAEPGTVQPKTPSVPKTAAPEPAKSPKGPRRISETPSKTSKT